MSITDKLRKYALGWDERNRVRRDLTAIADRIDTEHQKVLDKHDNERFNALMDARDKGVNAVLKEPEGFGLIALPKDADNMRWNIGDKDENGNEVIAFKLASDGWYVITDNEWPFRPEKCHHYHASTVESVLREFTDAVLEWAGKSGSVAEVGLWSDIAAEYAAKLQLKEN